MRLLRLLPLLFTRFHKEAVMFWHVMRHPQTPGKVKLAAAAAFLYLISPIDLIPDFIPVLGLLDDVGVVTLLLSIAYKMLPKDLYDALRAKVGGGNVSATASQPSPTPSKTWGGKREPQIIDVTPER
jgi:uncharacterized membrane protein YkvA (DUF1232 family)